MLRLIAKLLNHFFSKIIKKDFYSELTFEQQKGATYRRAYWYQEALKSVKDHPVVGQGIASSNDLSLYPQMKENMSLHFFFLEILVDVGLIGFLIFVLIYISHLIQLLEVFKNNKEELLGMTAVSIAIALSIFPISSISLSSANYYLPWFLLVGMGTSLIVYAENIRDVAENV